MKNPVAIILVSLTIGLFGHAKSTAATPPKFFQLVEDGGEHPSNPCAPFTKALPKLKKIKKFTSAKSYQGSNQIEFADKNEAGIDAFEHYYQDKAECEKMRTQLTKESEQ